MYHYLITYRMQVGCTGISDLVREGVQKMLREKGMAEATLASVHVVEEGAGGGGCARSWKADRGSPRPVRAGRARVMRQRNGGK